MLRTVFIAFVLARAIQLAFTWPVNCPLGDICNLAGRDIRIEGRIISLPSERLERTIIDVETRHAASLHNKGKIQVILPHTQYDLFYGDNVVLSGRLKMPEEDPEDNFSYPLYLAGRGIHSTMYNPDIEKITSGNDSQKIAKVFYGFREKIRKTINDYLTEPPAAIINAMIIGDQGMISPNLRDKYGKTGVVHILSVSGAHVTLVIGIIVYLASLFTARRAAMFAAVFSGVFAYLLVSGTPDCAVRAGIMGVLAFWALQKGRLASVKTLFWLSGAALLYFNPLDLVSDIGFQLSYLAVFGMIYLFPPLDKILCWGRPGWWWKISRILLVSLAVSLAVAPLVLYYFGILSLVSPVANLALLPFFSVLLPSGFILAGVGLLASFIGPVSVLGKMIAYLIELFFLVVQNMADLLLAIPGSHFSGSVKAGWLVIFYVLLMSLAGALNYLVKKFVIPKRLEYFQSEEFLSNRVEARPSFAFALAGKHAPPLQKKIKNIYFDLIGVHFKNKLFKISFLFWLLVVGCLLLISLNYLYSSSRPARLVMLNVGQGDAFMLNWPKYHFQILIDSGPGRRILPELGETLPFYDKHIEMAVLSHPHQDHFEGLINLLERYGVNKIYLPSLPQKNSPELYRVLWNELIEKEVALAAAKRGQKISFGAADEKIVELEFLTPFFDYSKNRIADVNDQSAVLKMNYPRRILFMGDSSQKVEKILLEQIACPRPDRGSHNIEAEILKIGHHGSRFSTSNEFLDAVHPQAALISTGKDNLFGHPAPATLKKLESRGIKIFRTDVNGRVEILLNKQE